jgi:hypothetical protein
MFEAFAILQGDNAFDQGRAVGYVIGGVMCVSVVVIVPIVLLVWSRKQKAVRVDLFHVYKNGQQCGPYSIEQIRAYLSTGEFQLTDMAWYQNAWVPLPSIAVIVGRTGRADVWLCKIRPETQLFPRPQFVFSMPPARRPLNCT